MAPSPVYITGSGQPPNGGVPPGSIFFGQPQTNDRPAPPPYNILVVPPPAVTVVNLSAAPPPYHAPAAGPAPAAPPPPEPSKRYAPPGITQDGAEFVQNGIAYLFPDSHTVIHFLFDGTRPFDGPPGCEPEFAALKIPTTMTVAGLMNQLGVPGNGNDRYGVTECVEVGNGSWAKGITYVWSEEKSKKTLKAIGWDDSRGTKNKPVWIAIYDKTRHGPA